MKGLARFLIRLYPATWRARYGEEFEALLEDSPAGFSSLFDLLKGAVKMQLNMPSLPKLALALGMAGLLAGLGISFLVSPRYVSKAVITLEASPGNSVSAREQFLACQNVILSRTSLSAIITDPRLDLYQPERQKMPLEEVIQNMKRNIQISVQEVPPSGDGKYLTFLIRFTYSDPVKTQQVVQALMTNSWTRMSMSRGSAPQTRSPRIGSRNWKRELRFLKRASAFRPRPRHRYQISFRHWRRVSRQACSILRAVPRSLFFPIVSTSWRLASLRAWRWR
ncbi:MAG TPA: hypothetical protein VG273_28075 [Bryobacteraceae bacterium]|jgi:hypothetical protein|nr:hypothetical protein [Bryobacteraceae bacterium]